MQKQAAHKTAKPANHKRKEHAKEHDQFKQPIIQAFINQVAAEPKNRHLFFVAYLFVRSLLNWS